ncbi:MAG: ABC transporter ATP-binding protein [Syntrophomonadaceae bacterium]|jgi:ABC-2 type transport system ATP-binding protein|nr:ABC transporter ATP-binding protein [Syntrophomonadaceae bacterium]
MNPAIETRELTRMFGDFVAVNKVSLTIEPGEVCGFLGPNGAGKSTLIRMLCGILTPSSGSGSVLGYDIVSQSDQIKQHIGYMSQKFSLYEDLTVRENLDFYGGVYGILHRKRSKRIREMLDLVGLEGSENRLVHGLSSGWRQRLALGCALISRPAVVFLDEPTSGVSPTSRRSFFDIIQRLANEGTTVIVTTHFMDEAERCNRLAFISQGHLIALDTPRNLKYSALQGYLVELEIPGAIERISSIESLPYVKECNLHGPLLHVLLQSKDYTGELARCTGTEPREITPSLEDVFIALSKNR